MTTADNYNFYQSTLWTHINKDIFLKPAFSVDFKWNTYQVICKEKKILWVILVRFQVLWIESWLFKGESDIAHFQKSITQWAKSYYIWKNFYTLYIQCGFTDILVTNSVIHLKNHESECIELFFKEKKISDNQKLSRGLRQSKKHNLPDSTIIINLAESKETLRSEIWKNTKEKIKKAEKLIQKWELKFDYSTDASDYDLFFDLYCKTAWSKGFGAITEWMRDRLKKSALEEDFARLFVVKDASWELISAAFCILQNNSLTYLYGANSRSYGNAWVSQFLQRNIIMYAKDNDIGYYDFLWASALWSNGDRLQQVTQFKLGFGWEKLEYAWSRDLITNNLLYRCYSLIG